MADGRLDRAQGKRSGEHAVHAAVASSVSDGGTYDTGLSSIDAATLTGTTDDEIITIGGVSGGTITVNVADNAGGAGTSQDVHVVAVGEA